MTPVCAGCQQNISDPKHLTCTQCKSSYDLECANVSNDRFMKMTLTCKKAWKCQACYCNMPKTGNTDTPIRPRERDTTEQINSPSEISNITIRKRTTKTMNVTTNSEDLNLLGDTICSQDIATTTQTETQTELTLQNLSEIIIQRLKENNKSIIAELQNTIQIEINKAILKLKEEVESKTTTLTEQNELRILEIQHTNTEIEKLKTENEKLKNEISESAARALLVIGRFTNICYI
ncbi:hypothetical protein HF086_017729 [Spodoptera exigua]|uniref:Uncharacterized protein n=1 Tax=Spodoptera exigua TaxID=7107 RepID=A0A922M2X5_SPOEX|nr:hypothetical protein HF086_017729 [Spodoptera exigua]